MHNYSLKLIFKNQNNLYIEWCSFLSCSTWLFSFIKKKKQAADMIWEKDEKQ